MKATARHPHETSSFTLAIIVAMIGVAAGLGGMAPGMLLHVMQHIAYGYSVHAIISQESFLQGVSAASPARRVLALSACGLVAGCGWWAVRRFGSPLVSISEAVSPQGRPMPFLSTVAHDLLQIVTVALGAPLGREVAPRELGAVLATWLANRVALTPEVRRILIACGAGAGLAAVYNVPLGGTLFILEVLLGTFSLSALIPALTTCVIAALVAWIGLGNETPYTLPPLSISPSLVAWSMVTGPVFGMAAHGFARLARVARARAPRHWGLIVWCMTVFAAIGLLAWPFPALLGNGKGLAQLSFDSELRLMPAAVFLLLRIVVTLGCLRAGAEGGLLTPGLTIGALLAIVLGGLWNLAWPDVPLGAFAVVGGAAFLAASMKMPLTSIVLLIEFTRVDHDFLIPISFAVAGSISVSYLCTLRNNQSARERVYVSSADPVPGAVALRALAYDEAPH
jgi:chloride channel protein, CIC family